jgi:hypothetical protein
MFTLTQTSTTTIKLSKTSKHQNNLYYTNFVSRLNSHQFMKLQAYFQLKSRRKKSCCTFVNFLTKFKTNNCCKTAKYILSKWKTITSTEFWSALKLLPEIRPKLCWLTEFVLAHAHNVENRPWHKQNGGQLCTPLCFHIPGYN